MTDVPDEHDDPVLEETDVIDDMDVLDDAEQAELVEREIELEVHERSRLFLPAFVIGWAIIAYGAMTALDNAIDAHPFALAVHVVTFDLGHDVVLVPIALAVSWLIGKLLPAVARGPVRAACAVSAMFVIFAYPLVYKWGKRPTNSSTLPLDYGRNLMIILIIVWALALATIARRAIRHTT